MSDSVSDTPDHDPHAEGAPLMAPEDAAMIPAPTGAPIVMAFGTTLLFAGLVTSPWVSVVGFIAFVAGIVGWWRDVLPRESMELIPAEAHRPIDTGPAPDAPAPTEAPRAPARKVLPMEVPRIRSGILGGLGGGTAMAAVALGWGAVQGSVWLPINLLAAMVLSSYDAESLESLSAFQTGGFLTALGIHLAFSIMIGLLLGAMMPMAARWPMTFSGIVAPVIWSLVTYTSMGVLDPALERYVDWWWFVGSQFAFGIVAGLIIARSEHISVVQYLSPAERYQLETNRGDAPTEGGGDDS